MSISAALKKCAKKHGLSDVQIAAAVDVAQSTVGRWRMGYANPRHEQYQKLIKIFPELPAMVALSEAS